MYFEIFAYFHDLQHHLKAYK